MGINRDYGKGQHLLKHRLHFSTQMATVCVPQNDVVLHNGYIPVHPIVYSLPPYLLKL